MNFPQVAIHKELGTLVVISQSRWIDYGAGSESFYKIQYGERFHEYTTRLSFPEYILIGEL